MQRQKEDSHGSQKHTNACNTLETTLQREYISLPLKMALTEGHYHTQEQDGNSVTAQGHTQTFLKAR